MKWIDVNERMPETVGKYLCYSEEGYISVERYSPSTKMIYCDSTDSGYATYWMPLPEPPTKEPKSTTIAVGIPEGPNGRME